MNWRDAVSGAEPVALAEMLEAREKRAALQKRLLAEKKRPLVCFTLNLPGEYKAFPLAEMCFEEGKALILPQLDAAGFSAERCLEVAAKTGFEAYYLVDGAVEEIKKCLLPLEEEHPLGRLFDIDVFGRDGSPLHGDGFGRGERRCLVCGGPVWSCARSRRHSAEELSGRAVQILWDYFAEKSAAAFDLRTVRVKGPGVRPEDV